MHDTALAGIACSDVSAEYKQALRNPTHRSYQATPYRVSGVHNALCHDPVIQLLLADKAPVWYGCWAQCNMKTSFLEAHGQATQRPRCMGSQIFFGAECAWAVKSGAVLPYALQLPGSACLSMACMVLARRVGHIKRTQNGAK